MATALARATSNFVPLYSCRPPNDIFAVSYQSCMSVSWLTVPQITPSNGDDGLDEPKQRNGWHHLDQLPTGIMGWL